MVGKNYGKNIMIWPLGTSLLIPVFLLVVSLVLGGCGIRSGAASPAHQRNESLAAAVKVELVKEPRLNAGPIDVRVLNGVVTLNGFVEDESQRQQAIHAAQRVAGVKSVIDHLQIK